MRGLCTITGRLDLLAPSTCSWDRRGSNRVLPWLILDWSINTNCSAKRHFFIQSELPELHRLTVKFYNQGPVLSKKTSNWTFQSCSITSNVNQSKQWQHWVGGPTWFFCGDVEGGTAGSEPSTVLGSDWDLIGCVCLQAREQSSGGADNPHSPCFTRPRSILPKQNLGTKTNRLLWERGGGIKPGWLRRIFTSKQ